MCLMAWAGRSVLRWMRMRITFCIPCGTSLSWVQISATSYHPRLRAAAAGYSALRPGVVVNQADATSSGWMSLAAIIASSNSRVASRMASRVLSLATVAPRIPLTGIYEFSLLAPPLPLPYGTAPPERGEWKTKSAGPPASALQCVSLALLLQADASRAAVRAVAKVVVRKPTRGIHRARMITPWPGYGNGAG